LASGAGCQSHARGSAARSMWLRGGLCVDLVNDGLNAFRVMTRAHRLRRKHALATGLMLELRLIVVA
jgi:hypothetical protein